MNHKDWKNKALFGRLMESFGYESSGAVEEELDEAHCGRREDEELEEGAKPDFLDLNKDGDKEQPMADAAKDVDEEKIREAIREAIKKTLK